MKKETKQWMIAVTVVIALIATGCSNPTNSDDDSAGTETPVEWPTPNRITAAFTDTNPTTGDVKWFSTDNSTTGNSIATNPITGDIDDFTNVKAMIQSDGSDTQLVILAENNDTAIYGGNYKVTLRDSGGSEIADHVEIAIVNKWDSVEITMESGSKTRTNGIVALPNSRVAMISNVTATISDIHSIELIQTTSSTLTNATVELTPIGKASITSSSYSGTTATFTIEGVTEIGVGAMLVGIDSNGFPTASAILDPGVQNVSGNTVETQTGSSPSAVQFLPEADTATIQLFPKS